jgi:AcrR family transcriptional regulator
VRAIQPYGANPVVSQLILDYIFFFIHGKTPITHIVVDNALSKFGFAGEKRGPYHQADRPFGLVILPHLPTRVNSSCKAYDRDIESIRNVIEYPEFSGLVYDPRMKQTKARNNRKQEIIEASANLFEKVGYHRASVQMIADEVGLGKPTLYHYFKSKTEILYAIHQESISNVVDKHLERVEQGLQPEELLEGMARDMLTFIKKHPGYVRAFFEHFDELDDAQKIEIRDQRNEYMRLTTTVIKDGIKSGVFRNCDPRLATLGFLGMLNWTYKWLPGEKQHSVSKVAKSLCAIYLDGLRT